jgi:hypothetical protein
MFGVVIALVRVGLNAEDGTRRYDLVREPSLVLKLTRWLKMVTLKLTPTNS